MKTLLTAPLGALLFVCATPCQGDGMSPKSTRSTTAIAFSEAGELVLAPGRYDMVDVVDGVAAYLDYNILYNEAELTTLASVRITRRTAVDKKGCWQLFGSLLYHKGLAILVLDPDAGFYEVVATNGPRSQDITNGALFVPHTEVESYADQKATAILTTVPLHNVNATTATNALRPFFAASRGNSGITLGNVGNNTDIVLQGFGAQVAAACRLLKLVDVGEKDGGMRMEVVRLKHAGPDDLVARLDATLGMAAVQAQVQYGMSVTGMPLRAVAHPALNAVVLSGSKQQIREARDLIAKLDIRGRTSQTQVIYLQHAAPKDIAARVDAVFGTQMMPAQARGGMVVGLRLRAVAHPSLNAVILSGTAEEVRDALELVAALDVAGPESGADTDAFDQRLAKFDERLQRLEQVLERVVRRGK